MPSHEIDRIRFWFRGGVREVCDVPPDLSVLHWLREDDGSTGTKEGCNQGDCGACTVMIGEMRNGDLALHTANSCLLPVPMLHGRALFTIEDLGSPEALHPIQRAMVEAAGSQCGFCTPGFVMSLWCAEEERRIDDRGTSRADLAESISGNLCRCTGYRPILDAAEAAAHDTSDRSVRIDREAVRTALAQLDEPGTLKVMRGDSAFIAPDTEDALANELGARPRARVISGGTDLVLSLRSTEEIHADDLVLVSTDRVAGMKDITASPDKVSFGAAASLEDAWRTIVERAPALERMHRRFAGPAIRATGTIGGNVVNGSPIADLTPVLMALDASLILRSTRGSRSIPITEFATGVRTNVLEPGEFLARIDVAASAFARDMRSYKVSRRFDDDISSVSATFALVLDGPVIGEACVVYGGMATTVRRATATEAVLRGMPWDESTLASAQAALTTEFAPISDHRATAHFRQRVAAGLLRRWWLETGVGTPSIPVDLWVHQ